ncbi:DEAD/DEAH box helicase [Rossellomorea vietnamensis]|uniref:DEAD/DEAH box helicase n=1 Tax=Rossellomorea vietnamensis TaxID=218284 RepID=A0A5D4MF44_9BACI|nr:DEAD/DEAH box helicase [Rossellomorea vietnamensis]TYR99943.1 DEAD/DEAH box helicase [Rossellomorea vietnamensis]
MEHITNLKPFLQDAWKKSEFTELTEVQEKAIPEILKGKNLVCESPTGTGKTLAYLLPILNGIDEKRMQAQALIVAPSHELVMQIHQEVQKWTKDSGINSIALIGGANVKNQIEKLKKKPKIIVGTTGRIMELIKMKKLKVHEIKTIVVDEFDLMIGKEHINNIRQLIKSTMAERQLLFFSATLSDVTDEVASELMDDYDVIRINQGVISSSKVEHGYLLSEQRDKIEVLRKLSNVKDIKALVFFNSLEKLSEVEEKLKYQKSSLEVLAGESKKMERKHSLDKFRAGKVPMLLTTDVAARGLDISGVTHVIHFEFPSDTKQYIHRSGRTGRMGASGVVISIVTKREESFLEKLARELDLKVAKKRIHGGEISDDR